jgi:predicted RND superfamily exporter protein
MTLGVASGVVIIVYFILTLVKKYITKTDKQQDFLPLIGMVLGLVIALALFYFDQESSLGIYVGDSVLTAILTGIGSGLVATGGNQVFKKINRLMSGDYDTADFDDEGLNEVINNIKDAKESLEDDDDK